MGDAPRPTRTAAFGLIVAIAVAGLVGYLIARPRNPLSAPPRPSASASSVPRSSALIGPASTARYSVADDIATHQILVFGGISDNAATWIWDGVRWTLAQPFASPPGRIDAAAAYDPALRLVLLFGGHGGPGTDLTDTWAWDGASWHEMDKGTGAQGPRSDASMTWDPALNEMVLVAGGPGDSATTTWVWSRTHWMRPQSGLPFPPAALSVAFDPSARALVAVASPQPVSSAGTRTETWMWDGSAWRRITTRNDPVAGVVVGLGWDPSTHRLLMFGSGTTLTDPGRLWAWGGTEWTQVPRALGVPILDGAVVSTDSALLLVGALDTSPQRPAPIKVWSWIDATWKLASG